jgi:glycosyltransferase involved in cell wall biosynthesis
MKKLLQINTVVNSASTGRIAEEIGRAAITDGWESYMAYGRNERTSISKKIKVGSNWDVYWHGVDTRLFDKHGLASKNATRKLVQKIDQIKPDIIHLHNIHGYYLNIRILFDYLSTIKTPVVWTLHDCWPITGHCTYFSFVKCDKWKTECCKCPQIHSYPASFICDRSTKNFLLKKELFSSLNNLMLVPVSFWLDELIKDSFLQERRSKVIHNGINIETFSPQENISLIKQKYNIADNKFIILGVASVWEKRKGLKDFIELSKLLKDDEVIVLVGLTKRTINNLPDNIIGIERTENVQELAKLYSAANVYVNPTWEDNYPTTNLEAISCGTPVITYKTGGSPESITPETGFIVRQGNLSELRKGIKIIKDKGADSYIKNCRQVAVNNFNGQMKYKEYIELYRQLLS